MNGHLSRHITRESRNTSPARSWLNIYKHTQIKQATTNRIHPHWNGHNANYKRIDHRKQERRSTLQATNCNLSTRSIPLRACRLQSARQGVRQIVFTHSINILPKGNGSRETWFSGMWEHRGNLLPLFLSNSLILTIFNLLIGCKKTIE